MKLIGPIVPVISNLRDIFAILSQQLFQHRSEDCEDLSTTAMKLSCNVPPFAYRCSITVLLTNVTTRMTDMRISGEKHESYYLDKILRGYKSLI